MRASVTAHTIDYVQNHRRCRAQVLQWMPLNRLWALRIPTPVRRWLVDRDSLTRQVTRACGGEFRVQVLQQSWQRPLTDDAAVLGISRSQPVIVREVQLMCDKTPWVYARSVIPRMALHGHYASLGQMGDRPLGEKLFADPIMIRGDVAFTTLQRGTELYQHAMSGVDARPRRVFGRRSLFTGARAPVLVTEFFLPTIGAFPSANALHSR